MGSEGRLATGAEGQAAGDRSDREAAGHARSRRGAGAEGGVTGVGRSGWEGEMMWVVRISAYIP
jgi:hypothetical protein